MKKIQYIVSLFILFSILSFAGGKLVELATTVPTSVVTQSSGFYIGAGVGSFTLENDQSLEELASTVGALIAGYEFSPYLSVEARYSRGLKDVDYTGGILTDRVLDSTYSNLALYAKLGYPLGTLKPYLLLGYGRSQITNLSKSDREESSFQYGAGASYRLGNSVELFADYIRAYDDQGFDGRSTQEDITLDLATIGIIYHF